MLWFVKLGHRLAKINRPYERLLTLNLWVESSDFPPTVTRLAVVKLHNGTRQQYSYPEIDITELKISSVCVFMTKCVISQQ